tara:strand:- start:389 stop:661 length:273 start_codon:yes stop_codon:yes gene_type:complete
MSLNILAWIVVMFFALGWSLGMFQERFRTRSNMLAVIWWWLSIAAVFILPISPFHLFYIMPLAAIMSNLIPGLFGSIILIVIFYTIFNYF